MYVIRQQSDRVWGKGGGREGDSGREGNKYREAGRGEEEGVGSK